MNICSRRLEILALNLLQVIPWLAQSHREYRSHSLKLDENVAGLLTTSYSIQEFVIWLCCFETNLQLVCVRHFALEELGTS